MCAWACEASLQCWINQRKFHSPQTQLTRRKILPLWLTVSVIWHTVIQANSLRIPTDLCRNLVLKYIKFKGHTSGIPIQRILTSHCFNIKTLWMTTKKPRKCNAEKCEHIICFTFYFKLSSICRQRIFNLLLEYRYKLSLYDDAMIPEHNTSSHISSIMGKDHRVNAATSMLQ